LIDEAFGSSRTKTFQGLLDQAGAGFVADQNFAATLALNVFVTGWGPKTEIPGFESGGHTVAHLFGVLLAVMLRDAGQHVFNQAAVAVVAKLNGGAFQCCAHRADGGAQFDRGL